MELRLIIVSIACFSCMVPSILGKIGIVKAGAILKTKALIAQKLLSNNEQTDTDHLENITTRNAAIEEDAELTANRAAVRREAVIALKNEAVRSVASLAARTISALAAKGLAIKSNAVIATKQKIANSAAYLASNESLALAARSALLRGASILATKVAAVLSAKAAATDGAATLVGKGADKLAAKSAVVKDAALRKALIDANGEDYDNSGRYSNSVVRYLRKKPIQKATVKNAMLEENEEALDNSGYYVNKPVKVQHSLNPVKAIARKLPSLLQFLAGMLSTASSNANENTEYVASIVPGMPSDTLNNYDYSIVADSKSYPVPVENCKENA